MRALLLALAVLGLLAMAAPPDLAPVGHARADIHVYCWFDFMDFGFSILWVQTELAHYHMDVCAV